MSEHEPNAWREARKCPPLKNGRVPAQPNKAGVCFSIERVKQGGKSGHIVSLHNRATGRQVGFVEFRAPGQRCKVTKDPFRAEILRKDNAADWGASCANELTPAKKARKKKTKKVKGRKKSR